MVLISGDLMEIKFYSKHFDKLKGLMFKKNFDYGIKFRCNGIHTFFMFEVIDVVLTDRNYKILYLYPGLKPNRIILPKKDVYFTFEFPKGYINDLKIGSTFNPK